MFELKAFFKELGLSDEEQAAVTVVLDKPERLTLLEKNQLRQADYSKQMNDLSKAQGQLKTANDNLNAEMAAWATEQAAGHVVTKKMRDDYEAAQLKVTQLTNRVTRIATDAGMDPTKALDGIDQTPAVVVPPTPTAPDLTGYVRADQFNGLATMALTLPAELAAIANEHFDLTGERLDTRTIIAEIQARAGTRGNQKTLDPRQIWEEQHAVPTKREAKATAAIDARLAEAERKGFERARSESALPVPPSHGERSPVLRSLDGQPRESVLKRPHPESAVNAARAAFADGRYRSTTEPRRGAA